VSRFKGIAKPDELHGNRASVGSAEADDADTSATGRRRDGGDGIGGGLRCAHRLKDSVEAAGAETASAVRQVSDASERFALRGAL